MNRILNFHVGPKSRRLISMAITGASLLVLIPSGQGAAAGHPSRPAAAPTTIADPSVQYTLQALDRLRSYGYTWTSDAGAFKAIKHWQRVNGLVVDGIVGIQTRTSLGLVDGPSQSVAGVVVPAPTSATPTKPAVRVDPPSQPVDPGSVEGIIRDVWPDELEDRAVQIAYRESRLQPGVRNACCYGLFQIHWGAHHSWLADFGIVSASQLFDARTNAEMAYQIYLRAGGWGPWSL